MSYSVSVNQHELCILGSGEMAEQLPSVVHLREVRIDDEAAARRQMRWLVETLLQDAAGEAQIYWLHAADGQRLWSLFEESFDKIQRAAGGAVQQESSQKWLAMQRRGVWDMPKGKCEKGETIEETAVREVEEETGLRGLKIRRPLPTTYHVFRRTSAKTGEEQLILKVSYWFEMSTAQTQTQPQTEEDIERIEWLEKGDFIAKEPIYQNILGLLRAL